MADTTFKKIDFENLSQSQKDLMAANAASYTQIVKDESGKPVINERTGRVETYTPTAEEYYNIRGGVNKSGYFGDAYTTAEQGGRPYLTEEEYNAALQGLTGVARGQAINLATAKKQYDLAISQGKTSAEATSISGYDPATNSIVSTSSTDSGRFVSTPSGTSTTSLAASQAANAAAAAATAERKSAYDLLYQQFAKYGLQALVTPLESLIKEGVPASEFAIRLRETDAYQKRFAANKARINKGLAALSEAEYIGLEDQYQNIMRQYGMPESYYARGDMGRQEGFEKLISGDVSAVELENRISNAYNRVINANPEVVQSLKQYYPSITNGDILSYVLDPEKGLTDINKKITAAEIGGAAMGAGLGIDVARAEQLGAFGVTKAQAQQGYQTIAEFLPTEMKLSEIYRRQGLGPYNQAVAEAEVFGLSGAAEAAQQRKKYTQLEQAQFSGQAGVGALARERAGSF